MKALRNIARGRTGVIGSRFGEFAFAAGVFMAMLPSVVATVNGEDLTDKDLELVRQVERQRIAAIQQVIGSVIAIYDEDRQGGGSGVIIDDSGIALTNHHVIMGAGVSGWGGLADGQLYHWKLIGTDPGGDVAIIQMEGRDDFPFTPLGDSDEVRVGDWALAMGNPFILTEDQAPTVTLGIVSGVKRYQPGAGANQLVYGNCIQVDSSINPGNSGGPLFNLQGQVIGINGRGSFQDRGRVNVGLGYAISANQIKNFIPDLLATKLVEHATLDASFSDRGGKVVCSTINRDAPVAEAGLELGDELLEFEGESIKNANQFTNLICTLPEDWPANLMVRKSNGEVRSIHVRTFGLPYQQAPKPKKKPGGEKPTPAEKKQVKRQKEMVELLSAPPGEVRFVEINQAYANQIVAEWQQLDGNLPGGDALVFHLIDEIKRSSEIVGRQDIWLSTDGRFRIAWRLGIEQTDYLFDGQAFYQGAGDGSFRLISSVEAKTCLPIAQVVSMLASAQQQPFDVFGEIQIDGSDKSQSQNAFRLKVADEDEDPFFVWLRMYDETGMPAPRLLKTAADKDGDQDGSVVFGQWQDFDGVRIPLQRDFTEGIAEAPLLNLVNQSCERVSDPDSGLFEAKAEEKVMEAATDKSDSVTDGPGRERP